MPTAAENRPRIALLLGASGATGKKLLPLLLADPGYRRVITLGRRELPLRHEKLDSRVVDFDDLASALKDTHADDAYCCFGTTLRTAGSKEAMTRIDHDFVVKFAKASRVAGASRFAYLSAANANAASPVFYSQLKGRTENALQTLGFADLCIFRPGMIVAERENRRLAESALFPLLPLIDRLMPGRLSNYRSIPVDTLAAAIASFSGNHGSGCRILHWRDMLAAARRET